MKRVPKYLAGYTGECCALCGRNGSEDPLETHHIFNGVGLRKKSERYGLTVRLCAHSCHNGGPNSVHRNQKLDLTVKQYGQRKAMEENGWTVEDFIREFGKNYLDEDEETREEQPARSGGFEITDEEIRFPWDGVPEDCFQMMA